MFAYFSRLGNCYPVVMNISKHISELLFDYECVILPGLGGFISSEHSATINRLTHEFNPPYGRLYFNIHLRNDDGLLLNHIRRNEGISYAMARQQLENQVAQIRQRLQQGEQVAFEGIGVLSLDDAGHITFEQDFKTNYYAGSYGLSPLVSPAVKRESRDGNLAGLVMSASRQQPKPKDRRAQQTRKSALHETKKKRSFALPVAAILLIALAVSFIWGLQHRDRVMNYWENTASLFPFDNSTPLYQPRQQAQQLLSENDPVIPEQEIAAANQLTETSVTPDDVPAETTVPSSTPKVKKSTPPEKDVKIAEPEPEPKASLPEPTTLLERYHVITGSFGKRKNADRLVRQLEKKGYQAKIADTNAKGMFRVACISTDDLDLAKEKLLAVREDENPNAWILKK